MILVVSDRVSIASGLPSLCEGQVVNSFQDVRLPASIFSKETVNHAIELQVRCRIIFEIDKMEVFQSHDTERMDSWELLNSGLFSQSGFKSN